MTNLSQITNLKVLLVEDDIHITKMYTKFLMNAGAEVLHASDGAQALELLALNTVDVLLMDLGMPGLNGYDTLQNVRKNKHTQALPVIILSNTTIDERHGWYKELHAMGISGVYRKYETPLRELSEIISKALLRDSLSTNS